MLDAQNGREPDEPVSASSDPAPEHTDQASGTQPTADEPRHGGAPWKRFSRLARTQLHGVLEREAASYEAGGVSLEHLSTNLTEAAKQSRNLFLLHMSVSAYALMSLLGVQDQHFFSNSSGVRMPLLDLTVGTRTFFLVTPCVLIAINAYLNIYLAYVHRIQRRMSIVSRALDQGPIDPDACYPWIATLAHQRGPFGEIVRGVYNLLVWWLTPTIAICYWLRALPFRGSIRDLGTQNLCPPASEIVGALAVVGLVIAVVWSALRREMDLRFLRASTLGRPLWGLRVGVLASLVVLVGGRTFWHDRLCAQFPEVVVGCSVDLRTAILSRPPNSATAAAGVSLIGVNLLRAEMDAVYLERAKVQRSSLVGAFMTNGMLEGASFMDVEMDGAAFQGSNVRRAWFTDVSLRDGRIEWADFGGTLFIKTDMQGCLARGARFDLIRAVEVNLERAQLSDVSLIGADLSEARLRGASLARAHLEGASLRGADLSNADLSHAVLDATDLTGAKLEGAIFTPHEKVSVCGTCPPKVACALIPADDCAARRRKAVEGAAARLPGVRDLVENPAANRLFDAARVGPAP